MKVSFKRPQGFRGMGRRVERDLRGMVTTKLVRALTDFHQSLMETPVYTGRTLVNMRWNLGTPETAARAAVKDPALPGKTSDLAIGTEPRRTANATIINEEFVAMIGSLRVNPFQNVYMNNNLEHFSDVEYGTYGTEGKGSRTPPGGMTRRGEAAIENHLEGLVRRVA